MQNCVVWSSVDFHVCIGVYNLADHDVMVATLHYFSYLEFHTS